MDMLPQLGGVRSLGPASDWVPAGHKAGVCAYVCTCVLRKRMWDPWACGASLSIWAGAAYACAYAHEPHDMRGQVSAVSTF